MEPSRRKDRGRWLDWTIILCEVGDDVDVKRPPFKLPLYPIGREGREGSDG